MVAAILTIVAALTPALGLLLTDWLKGKFSPINQNASRYDQIDKDIATHSAASVVNADNDLAELERLQHSQGH